MNARGSNIAEVASLAISRRLLSWCRHGKKAGNIADAASCRANRDPSYLVLAFGDDRSRSLALADEAAAQAQASDHQHQG